MSATRKLADRMVTAPALLTIEHAAAHVALSAPTFLREVERGSMPAARIIGRKAVWLREELDVFARALPQQAEAEGDDNPLVAALTGTA